MPRYLSDYEYLLQQSAFSALSGGTLIPDDHVLWQSAKGIPPDLWGDKGLAIPLADVLLAQVILATIDEMYPELIDQCRDPFILGLESLMVIKQGLRKFNKEECIKKLYNRKLIRFFDDKCVEELKFSLIREIEPYLRKVSDELLIPINAKKLPKFVIDLFILKIKIYSLTKTLGRYYPHLSISESGTIELVLLSSR